MTEPPAFVVGNCIVCDGEIRGERDAPRSIGVRCPNCGREQRWWQAIVRSIKHGPLPLK